jgi:hypothetical protein
MVIIVSPPLYQTPALSYHTAGPLQGGGDTGAQRGALRTGLPHAILRSKIAVYRWRARGIAAESPQESAPWRFPRTWSGKPGFFARPRAKKCAIPSLKMRGLLCDLCFHFFCFSVTIWSIKSVG